MTSYGRMPGSEQKRLIGLDLLRATAISFVLFLHFGAPALELLGIAGMPRAILGFIGPLGVEMFFALSGFLIGRLLIDIVEREPSWRACSVFLVRRWMRTLPLYVLWVVVLLLVFTPPDPLWNAAKYLALLQNLAWPMPTDNWFGVSWSLTIEEWFYILFATLLIGLAARTRHAILIACAVFIVVPVLARLFIEPASFEAGLRKVVVFRLDAIAYGVLMAWAYRTYGPELKRWRHVLLALGVLVAALPAFSGLRDLLSTQGWHAAYFVLLPAGCALLMPWAVSLRLAVPVLAPPIIWLAGRSYCLYVTHITLQQLMGRAVDAGYVSLLLAGPLLLLACAIVAELSYRYFETPILRMRPPQFPGKVKEAAKRDLPAHGEGELPAPKPV